MNITRENLYLLIITNSALAGGDSAKNYIKGLYWFSKYKKIRMEDFHMFLFDSFEGMPPAKNEQEAGDTHVGMFKGHLNTVKQRLNAGKS